MRPLSIPSIPEAERYVVSRTSIPNCYRLTVRHGYTDIIVTPDLARLIVQQLVLHVTRDHSHMDGNDNHSASSKTHSPEVQAELDAIEKAYSSQTVYVMGKEQMKVRKGTWFLRRALLEAFLWIRENSRAKVCKIPSRPVLGDARLRHLMLTLKSRRWQV
jgi:KUP system potassium uptake protein